MEFFNEQFVTKLSSWGQQAVDNIYNLAAENIPPFIVEYLTWKFYQNLCDAVLSGALLAAIIYFVIKACKWIAQDFVKSDNNEGFWYNSDGFACIPYIIVGIVAIAFSIGAIINIKESVYNCIEIKVAPKVFVVEECARLYKEQQKK